MAALHNGEATTSLTGDGEAPPPTTADRRRGGWTTSPFIIATVFGLTLGTGGFLANLILFLINKFNIESIEAAQIANVVSGCINFFPLIGAIVADSLIGCFSVIWVSSLFSLLGLILLLLTVTTDGLRPNSSSPTTGQFAVLYSALALVAIGVGGTRFTLATMGANQFTTFKHQSIYFNWFFFSFYGASFISSTVMVYVEDNLGWALGLGLCITGNIFGLGLFLIGSRYYNRDKPLGPSPFTSLVQVIVASVRKRKAVISSQKADYYYGDDLGGKDVISEAPTKRFGPLNRAALKTEGDIQPNGSITTPWKLCTVQQVEDLKSLLRILPLWTSSILLGTPIGVQSSLTVLQALTTNRHLSHHFQLPPASIMVFSFLSTVIGITLIHHCLEPLWKKLLAKNPTPLQQIGIGHVFTIASMAVSAVVESKRRSHRGLSVLWLVPQMVVVGVGKAFHFPAQVGLYYQEFPASMKTLATAMVAMLIGVAFYLSTAVVGFVRRATDWLPDDIDHGRVDCVYWVMVGIGIVNFGYYLLISWFFKYKNVEVVKGEDRVSSERST